MKAIILDMYGVIVKQTGDDFVPYVQQTFPQLKRDLSAAQSLGMKAVMLNSRNVEWDGDVVQNYEELAAKVL